jgi:DNA-binding transcriptional LysR family regulator
MSHACMKHLLVREKLGCTQFKDKLAKAAYGGEHRSPMPSLADLSAIKAVARHRSFRAAAEELGLTRSAVSHTIRTVEAELATRLFHRSTRSVAPTEAGARLLERLRPTLRELREMLAEVRADGAEPAGALRINAIQAAVKWLVRHVVPQFLATHPHVTLDLVSQDRFVDIVADEFDAGVRLEEAVPRDMIAIPFGGRARFLAIAAPEYLAHHGVPTSPDDLLRHRCIRQRLASGRPYRWEFALEGDEVAIDVPGVLTLDNNECMVEAAIAGLGLAYVPERAATVALERGLVFPVLEAWSPTIGGFCLYYPGHRHVPRPLRTFIDLLRATNGVQRTSFL